MARLWRLIARKNAQCVHKIPQVEPNNVKRIPAFYSKCSEGDGENINKWRLADSNCVLPSREQRPALGIAALLTVRCCNLEKHNSLCPSNLAEWIFFFFLKKIVLICFLCIHLEKSPGENTDLAATRLAGELMADVKHSWYIICAWARE